MSVFLLVICIDAGTGGGGDGSRLEGWGPSMVDDTCCTPAAAESALAKALILSKRCLGSLASALVTTSSIVGSIVGTFSLSDGGGANRCWVHSSVKVP